MLASSYEGNLQTGTLSFGGAARRLMLGSGI